MPLADRLAIAEQWFTHHGLPWFTEHEDARIAKVLRLRALIPVAVLAVAVSSAAGVATWGAEQGTGHPLPTSVAAGLVAGATVLGLLGAVYALVFLRAGSIIRWAARRALGDLSLLVPLITRALPLLLMFNTFLFINADVWQLTSLLDRSALWGIVLLFCGVAVAFLLAQLPQELAKVMDQVSGGGVRHACEGTPVSAWAGPDDSTNDSTDDGLSDGTAAGTAHGADLTLSPRQRANLLLVLLIAQAVQVLLLAVSVFGFFVLFGLVAVGDGVVHTWTGSAPHPIAWETFDLHLPVSNELFQVSVFLAAFSGLYFTVYAVSDPTYREQFFTRISRDLEQAVGVRAVYQALLSRRAGVPD